jgi:hypothetical protein
MPQAGGANTLDFEVEPLSFFFQFLLAGLSLLIYKPAAENWVKLIRMFTDEMKFSDGTKVRYTGNAASIDKQILGVSIVIWAQIVLGLMIDDPYLTLGLRVAMGFASGYVAYDLLVAIASHLVTNRESHLAFSGTREEYLKWQMVFVGCSVVPAVLALLLPTSGLLGWLAWAGLSVIGFVLTAVVILPYSQWFVSKFTGGARVARFDSNPVEIVGTYVIFVLVSLLIVTIPWSLAWYLKWYFGRVSLPLRAGIAGDGYSV